MGAPPAQARRPQSRALSALVLSGRSRMPPARSKPAGTDRAVGGGNSMTSAPAIIETRPPATAAWTMLALVSLALFGNYYVYDSIAPVADLLQRQLGFSDSQLGVLNAIYSAPNIVMVLIGGVIVDRFGAGRSTLWFAAICLIGAVLTAATPNFPVMA